VRRSEAERSPRRSQDHARTFDVVAPIARNAGMQFPDEAAGRVVN